MGDQLWSNDNHGCLGIPGCPGPHRLLISFYKESRRKAALKHPACFLLHLHTYVPNNPQAEGIRSNSQGSYPIEQANGEYCMKIIGICQISSPSSFSCCLAKPCQPRADGDAAASG